MLPSQESPLKLKVGLPLMKSLLKRVPDAKRIGDPVHQVLGSLGAQNKKCNDHLPSIKAVILIDHTYAYPAFISLMNPFRPWQYSLLSEPPGTVC